MQILTNDITKRGVITISVHIFLLISADTKTQQQHKQTKEKIKNQDE